MQKTLETLKLKNGNFEDLKIFEIFWRIKTIKLYLINLATDIW